MFVSPSSAGREGVSGPGHLGGLVGRAVHGGHLGDQGVVELVEDPTALLHIVAVEPYDERLGRLVAEDLQRPDRKSTRLNSSHANISYAVFCLQKTNAPIHTFRPVESQCPT